MKKYLIIIFLFLCTTSFANIYYVSGNGSDSNNGKSPTTPWLTLTKVNDFTFTSGDTVKFNGGDTFIGRIVNQQGVGFTSYGKGLATISSNSITGFYALNNSNIFVSNLIFIGSGIAANTVDGIHIENSQVGNTKLQNVTISNVNVSGYGYNGIIVTGSNGYSGFNNVRILNSVVHDCTGGVTNGGGTVGIVINGAAYGSGFTTSCHTNVLIDHCIAFHNTGKSGDTNWTGSGIIIAQTNGGVIQHCIANNNGANSTSTTGGPVGIWFVDGINYLGQYNESYKNKTGHLGADGGGFDIDGGCYNTIFQYNYSHDNEGSGFQIYTYNDGKVTGLDSAVVRYNISQNDAVSGMSNQGNIIIGNDGGSVGKVYVYNNTFYQQGTGKCLIFEGNVSGLTGLFSNNVLFSASGANVIKSNNNNPTYFALTGNDYYTPNGFAIEWGNTDYRSLSSWQKATGKEKISGVNVAKTANPIFNSPGNGGTINAINIVLKEYRISSVSTLIGKGLDLHVFYGVDVGKKDFYGNQIPNSLSHYDIGAYQHNAILIKGK